MKLTKYPLSSNATLTTFEFVSQGTKGEVHKLVQFSPTNYKDVYNLAFGDLNIETGEIDDKVITNNGDSQKVLATVAGAIYAFADHNPNAMIYATGSSSSRTRLYQMGISNHIAQVSKVFDVYGQLNGEWQKFRKGTNYEGFLIKCKMP